MVWRGGEVHVYSSCVIQDVCFDTFSSFRPHMMDFVPQLAPKFPNLSFIIDHLAKPKIKEKEIEEWKTKMTLAATYQNVYCKL